MEFGLLLRLVGVMDFILILSCPFYVQKREPYRHLQCDFFQTWYDDRDHYALHFGISLDDLDLHSRAQLYEKSKTPVSIFSQISP